MLRHVNFCPIRMLLVAIFNCAVAAGAASVHHYVFFGQDREGITNQAFLNTEAANGAQLKYTWRGLARQKGQYDFGDSELRYSCPHGRRNAETLLMTIPDILKELEPYQCCGKG